MRHMRWLTAVAGMLALHLGVGTAGGDDRLVLVEDGASRCLVVAEDGLSVSEELAVAKLRKYIKMMSGAEVDVATPAQAAGTTFPCKIVVGNKTVRALYPNVNLDGLGTDGFWLKTEGNALLIGGAEKRGTLYGVYELLHMWGCRWWAIDVNTIPARKTLSIASLNMRIVPVVEYRDMLYGDRQWVSAWEHGGTFYTRNRLNGFNYSENEPSLGGRVEFFPANLVHSWGFLMRPVGEMDGSFEKHPEYWAYCNGKRVPDQVCPMHPMVAKIMTANLLRELREKPGYSFVVVGQEDNFNYCRCDDCLAIADVEGVSGPGIILANKIAEALEKEFPDIWVMTPAYEWSQKPPKTIKPRHNVGVTLCSIQCDFNRPIEEMTTPGNKDFAEDIIAWGKITKKLYIWDYTTNFHHYLLPFPNLDAIVPNVKFFVRHGAKGILFQGSHTTRAAEFSQLRMWVLARAAWDPENADGPALINEFVDNYYGAAAPWIKKYIDIIHSPGRADPAMSVRIAGGLDAPWLTPEVIAAGMTTLLDAERAVANDPVLLQRVQHALLPISYVLLKRGVHSKTWSTVARITPLDLKSIAARFAKAVRDSQIGQIGEFQDIGPLVGWVIDYAAKRAPLPPELEGVDPATYRLIQACQMNTPGTGHWEKDPMATDGWVVKVSSVAWLWTHSFSTPLDIEEGKTYKVFLRIKVAETKPAGEVMQCGVWKPETRSHFSGIVTSSQLEAGKFKVVEAGQFVASDKNPFWMALASSSTQPAYVDCMWLQEMP